MKAIRLRFKLAVPFIKLAGLMLDIACAISGASMIEVTSFDKQKHKIDTTPKFTVTDG